MKYLEEIGLPKHGLRLPMRLSKDLDFAALQSGRCWPVTASLANGRRGSFVG